MYINVGLKDLRHKEFSLNNKLYSGRLNSAINDESSQAVKKNLLFKN